MATRPEAPAPMLRRGPRPLLMHLMLAANSQPSGTNSPGSGTGSSNWNESPQAFQQSPREAGGKAAERVPESTEPAGAPSPPHLPTTIDAALLAGIAAYRRHPFFRDLPEAATLWQENETRLLDFGPQGGIPAIFVPSLVNRETILDLTRERSLMRWLSRQGVRAMLLEWGWPGPEERSFTVTDYIERRLEPALEAAVASHGGPVILVGYCMGGMFCVASALRRPELVAALGLIATPWDFRAADPALASKVGELTEHFDAAMKATGTLPIDALQCAFAGLDPASIWHKFRSFGLMPQDDERTRLFVAIEDWLNDGVPLAAPVALECAQDWYGENLPARGLWRVAGQAIQPEKLKLPVFAALPQRDRIVPPESSEPLAAAIRHATMLKLPGGHVSVVAGPRAPGLLWEPLLEWFRSVAPKPRRGKRRARS